MHETLTARGTRIHRPAGAGWKVAALLLIAGLLGAGGASRSAGQPPEGIRALLPGTDTARLQAAAEVRQDSPSREAVTAAAKLLWSISRVDRQTLNALAAQQTTAEGSSPSSTPTLEVVRVRGTVAGYDAVRLPPELADVLEFDRLYRVELRTERGSALSAANDSDAGESSDAVMQLLVRQLPAAWTTAAGASAGRSADGDGANGDGAVGGAGQLVAVTGVKLSSGATAILLADRLQWFPAGGEAAERLPLGWRMLAAEGVDIGQLSEVAVRNRQPLAAEDREAFYEVLAAASRIGTRSRLEESPASPAPASGPTRIRTVEMLEDPAAWVGRWVRMDLETARLTRVAVTSPELRELLGRDAYWQIDAFGDLGGTRVQLEPLDGEGEPLVFENRFPVSLAVLELPEWLSQQLEPTGSGGESGGAEQVALRMLSEPVTVDGFFFRLWSYGSGFTESRGGRQISPLILVSTLRPQASVAVPERSVMAIGWGLAAVVIGGIVLGALVLWRVGRRDRAVARARRAAAPTAPPSPREPW